MKQNQQKIEAEAEKLYPKILISVIGDDLNDNQFIDGNKEKRDIWIAGRSAGLEREKEYREVLADLALQYKMVVEESLNRIAVKFEDEIDHLPSYKKAIELLNK